MNLPKLSKKDVVYLLIILNIIILSTAYVQAKNFYAFYSELLINSANAEIRQSEAALLMGTETASAPAIGSKDWIKEQWLDAGMEWEKIYALIQCESKFDPFAIGDEGHSRGLYQIHKKYHPNVSNACAFSPECSTKWAVEKWQHDGNLSAWSCARILGI